MIMEDATRQLAALRAGTLTPQQLMAETLDQIDALNPGVNAIVALRPRAVLLDEAGRAPAGPRHRGDAARARRWSARRSRSPSHWSPGLACSHAASSRR